LIGYDLTGQNIKQDDNTLNNQKQTSINHSKAKNIMVKLKTKTGYLHKYRQRFHHHKQTFYKHIQQTNQ
jgi:hypothetical protein